MPAVTVAELKPGDTIVISSTSGVDPSKVTAIAVVTGIDALMNAMQPRQNGQGAGRGNQQSPDTGFGNSGIDFGIGLP